jgi:hypothetical protein
MSIAQNQTLKHFNNVFATGGDNIYEFENNPFLNEGHIVV